MYAPVLGCDEWQSTLERLVDWANFLIQHTLVTPTEAFERIAKLLGNEHFGIEHCTIDNFDDINDSLDPPSMKYLNMGDTYATTLVLTDDYVNGVKLLVTCWGDWVEQNEQHHCAQSGYVRCGYCGHFTPFDYGDEDGNGSDDWHNHQCSHCKNNVSGGEYVAPAISEDDED